MEGFYMKEDGESQKKKKGLCHTESLSLRWKNRGPYDTDYFLFGKMEKVHVTHYLIDDADKKVPD